MNSLAPLRCRKGFTLVEIMVAMVVLALMMAGLASIIGFVSKTWLAGINIVDNFSKARVMLNLLDRDIQMMVFRRDVGAFVNASSTPACAFYTKVQGNQGSTISDPRALSLVQYNLPAVTATSSVLQRIELGLFFSGGTMALSYPLPTSPTLPTSTFNLGSASLSSQTEIVGSGVIAFQYQFIDGTGNLITPTASTPFKYDFTNPTSAANYRAVVVSIAVMSNNAYNLAIDSGNLVKVAGYFSLTPPTGQTYAQVWNTFLANPAATQPAYLSLPAPLRGPGSILVFQRFIPLPGTLPASSS